MRIAYLVNQYPKVSHSFIRREIHALERQGFEVMRIALRGWDLELVDPEDQAERTRTHYVLRGGALTILLSAALMIIMRPVRFVQTLTLAWRMSRRAERPLPVHLIYLAEACLIETWLRAEICSIYMRTSAPIRPRLRCWCMRSAGRHGALPFTARRNSTRRR